MGHYGEAVSIAFLKNKETVIVYFVPRCWLCYTEQLNLRKIFKMYFMSLQIIVYNLNEFQVYVSTHSSKKYMYVFMSTLVLLDII